MQYTHTHTHRSPDVQLFHSVKGFTGLTFCARPSPRLSYTAVVATHTTTVDGRRRRRFIHDNLFIFFILIFHYFSVILLLFFIPSVCCFNSSDCIPMSPSDGHDHVWSSLSLSVHLPFYSRQTNTEPSSVRRSLHTRRSYFFFHFVAITAHYIVTDLLKRSIFAAIDSKNIIFIYIYIKSV